jgi:tetraacyldisaccharide 4'-kinase
MLRSRGIEVIGRPLADHARLTPEDIEFGDDKSVFMTEKDAVKCTEFAGTQHWYVPVSACFDGGEADTLLDIVLRKIEKRDQASQGPTHG